jgi:hypothetical protein
MESHHQQPQAESLSQNPSSQTNGVIGDVGDQPRSTRWEMAPWGEWGACPMRAVEPSLSL